MLSLTGITALLLWSSYTLNVTRRADERRMIEQAVTGLQSRIEKTARAFVYWPETGRRLQDHDRDWLQDQLASQLASSYFIDLTGLGEEGEHGDTLWLVDPAGEIRESLMGKELFATLRKTLPPTRQLMSGLHNSVIELEGRIYFLSSALFQPTASNDEEERPAMLLVFGRELTPQVLAEIGSTTTLSGLTLHPPSFPGLEAATTDGYAHSLRDASGMLIGHLIWTPQYPGEILLRQALLPASIVCIMLIGMCAVALRLTRSNAVRLREQESRATWLAHHDSLTKLPNRENLLKAMGSPNVLAECAAGHAAMMLIDITGLRDINNAVGQIGGNHLIRMVAERLTRALPPSAFLARTGGDEFDVLLISPNPEEEIRACAEVIYEAFATDYTLCGQDFQVRASVGYASSQRDFCSIAELKRRCDLAVLEAKRTRSGVPLRYTPDLDSVLNNHRDLEVRLRQAIADRQINVVYQPIICARTRSLRRVEALSRWTPSEAEGPISPEVFISVAEQAGLIIALGQSILEKICRDMQIWPALKVSINASPKELADPRYVARLIRTCRDHHIAPSRIAIELTEGVLVTQPEVSRMRLNALRAAGFEVFLDDFGDGFSSIGYLRRLPFDTLKIDRSFTRDLTTSDEARQLIVAITAIARALHMKVVAEGVETEEQANLLFMADIDHLQGYLFGAPMCFADLINRFGEQQEAFRPLRA